VLFLSCSAKTAKKNSYMCICGMPLEYQRKIYTALACIY
jgi:hypothetical protein